MTDNPHVRPGLVIFDPETRLHDPGSSHPESPERVAAALRGIKGAVKGWSEIHASAAAIEAIEDVHDRRYLEAMEEFCRKGGGVVIGDTVASPGTFDVALRAAGGVIQGVEAAADGTPAICLSRPPGHHASQNRAQGFCFLNHAAIAARSAQRAGIAERVAIFDFDVHHGNGTSDIFWSDPSVAYISIHQWPWYPGTGALEDTGASGNIVNIPMPAYSGDEEHLAVTSGIVLPVIRSFKPDIVVVSAGFDAHADDPLSLQTMTAQGFGLIAGAINALSLEVCGIPIVITLEGGYDTDALEESVGRMALALDPSPTSISPSTGSEMPVGPSIERVFRFHLSRWAS